jgi:hypothetical protein
MSDNYLGSWVASAQESSDVDVGFAGWLIGLRCKNLRHSEYIFSGRYGRVCFSFSLANGKAGRMGAGLEKIRFSNPDFWKFTLIPMTDEEEDYVFALACVLSNVNVTEARAWARARGTSRVLRGPNNWKYDVPAILLQGKKKPTWKFFVLHHLAQAVWRSASAFISPHPYKAICSEGVCMLIQSVYTDFNDRCDAHDPESLDKEWNEYLDKLKKEGKVR